MPLWRYVAVYVLAGWVASGAAANEVASLYGRADGVWDAKISPSGRHVALGCSPGGQPAICVYDLETGAEPRVLYSSSDSIRLLNFYWASNQHVVSNAATYERIRTSSGLRHYDFRRAIAFNVTSDQYAVLMRDAGLYVDLTQLVSICPSKPDKIMMQVISRVSGAAYTGSRIGNINAGVRSRHFEVDLASGRGRELPRRDASIIDTLVDENCNPSVHVIHNDQRGDFAIEAASTRRRVFQMGNARIQPMSVLGLSGDRQSVIVQADYDDRYGLHTIQLDDGTIRPLTIDGMPLGNLGVLKDNTGTDIIGFYGHDDLEEHYYTDAEMADLQDRIEAALNKTVRIQSYSDNRSVFTLAAEAPGVPTEFYLYDAIGKELSPLGSVAPQLADRPPATITPIRYRASDGLEIPGYLTLPPGKTAEEGPFPTIILPHGGPEARDTASFDWWAQAYASAGYAVIQPNFRGSSGYGQEFRDAGFGEFGGRMIDDIVDAIAWAEQSGIADDRGVCVAGASYGGYAALMSGLRAPDKVGCIVAVAPVTSIYNHMARYGRDSSGYSYWLRYVGSDAFSESAVRREVTPADRAADYRMPVFLLHGRNDWVVEISQSRAFASGWGRRAGLTFIELDGEDHYLRTTRGRYEVLANSLDFLTAHHPAKR